jgi:hypothetical protein
MAVTQIRRQDKISSEIKLAKLEERRRNTIEKVRKEEKLRDINGYKVFRADLVQTEKKMANRSIDIKVKNMEDFTARQQYVFNVKLINLGWPEQHFLRHLEKMKKMKGCNDQKHIYLIMLISN